MASLIVDMGLDDRLCVVQRGKRIPYCIVRVIEINRGVPEQVVFWLSLHHKSIKLNRGEDSTVRIDDWTVNIKLLMLKPRKAVLRFEADANIKLKPLRRMERKIDEV